MTGRRLPGLVCGAALAFLAGCPRGTGPVATPPPGPVAVPAESGLQAPERVESVESGPAMSVVSLEVGGAYDFRGRALRAVATSFPGDTPVLYAVGRLRNVGPPGRVEGRWVHLDSDTHLGDTRVELVGAEVEARFSLSKPTAGWPEGRYKFYLAVNGEDVAGVAYSVTGAAPGTGNPAVEPAHRK